MDNEIDLSKYQIRTDIALDEIDKESNQNGIRYSEKNISGISVTKVILNKKNALNKKKGKYITLEFEDATDTYNVENLIKVLTRYLKEMINIKKDDLILVVGLGNNKSTPDSLGPLTIDNIIVTNHLYILGEMSDNYNRVATITPGVMADNGIETSDIIESVVKKINPNIVIIIDSLASKSIERLNKTIQITDTGIHPGSGIGNKRKEISKDTLGIPVIAIGVPTVVDASVIVSDTINFIYKNYAYNKDNIKNPKFRFTFNNVNYLNKNVNIDIKDKEKLLGLVGTLNDEELQLLIYEVLNPIGYNLMVTPKEVDFVIKKISSIISKSINNAIHDIDKK